MADPFSIIAGTAGLADICVRFTKLLKDARDGFKRTEGELEELSNEVLTLSWLNGLIGNLAEAYQTEAPDSSDEHVIAKHWQAASLTLWGCQDILGKLSGLLVGILEGGRPSHPKYSSLRKYLKQQLKEGEFVKLRQKLTTHQAALQTSLIAINILLMRNSQVTSETSFSELSDQIQTLGSNLQAKADLLHANLEDVVLSAKSVLSPPYLNRHFSVPQSVSSIFTGRASYLEVLEQHLVPSSTNECSAQKRFVVYGLPGSGKTQFCCKFATDNKQRFWGVFWIDASSVENATQSFSAIARAGRVEPNERAAKSWLSSLSKECPWLLIVDNVDQASLSVEEYFPESDNGAILITTRNPTLKVQGTVGPRYFQFGELEEFNSVELLLKAADEPLPWSQSTLKPANEICKTLGCLPLALVHAGKTILAHQCSIDDYLSFFDKNWSRIRKLKSSNDSRAVADANAAIYSTYELIHEGLVNRGTQASDDALEILKIFSFLHGQNIRVDIFFKAASNPRIEALEQERKTQEDKQLNNRTRGTPTWRKTLRTHILAFVGFLEKLGYHPVLPRFMKDATGSGSFDELRLTEALKELYEMSLIYANPGSKDANYSVHPAVHLWVRERPEMTIADQAVWCQIATTVLAQAILLPPLGDKEEDEIFRRDLLPHIRHVQTIERTIRQKILDNQESRKRSWPVLQTRLNRPKILQLVKFSLVYAQCGLLKEAEELQLQVAAFAENFLGTEHTSTMDILLMLSMTYWQLNQARKAVELQKRVLEACIRVRGYNDLKTLKIMDAYGSSCWQQGRVSEAREVHQTAVEGFKNVLGDNHIQTLRAMDNLGRAMVLDFDFTSAIGIHIKVVDGLHEQLGASHLDTLTAADNLAMAYFQRVTIGFGRPGDLDKAVTLAQNAFDQRREKLGREHVYTLWSGLNLARIKGLRGETDEAISIFLAGHAIALRNLGEKHFAVLFAKMHYGRILVCAKKYVEAESILSEVTVSHEKALSGHPNRLLAIHTLIRCRNLLGKKEEAETATLLEELEKQTAMTWGPDHDATRFLLDPKVLNQGVSDIDKFETECETESRISR